MSSLGLEIDLVDHGEPRSASALRRLWTGSGKLEKQKEKRSSKFKENGGSFTLNILN